MNEENTDCVVDLNSDDPSRYKRMLDLVRDVGGNHAWTSQVPTGELSCWTIGDTVVFVQRICDSVEVYSNAHTPRTWIETEDWLKTL